MGSQRKRRLIVGEQSQQAQEILERSRQDFDSFAFLRGPVFNWRHYPHGDDSTYLKNDPNQGYIFARGYHTPTPGATAGCY